MSATLLAHATGLAALGLSVSSSMHRCDRRLRHHGALAGVCWALNFLVLDAPTGFALSCLSALRTGTASMVVRHDLRLRAGACMAFIAISIATATLTWQNWTTLLPVASSILTTYAVFFLSGPALRAALLLAALLWTQNVLALHSLEQILGNFLGIVAAAIGLWRCCAAQVPASLRAGTSNPGERHRPEGHASHADQADGVQ